MNMKNAEFKLTGEQFENRKTDKILKSPLNTGNKADLKDLFEFDIEQLKVSKCRNVIGTDEAGRGPAAGPIYAAAVCFKSTPFLNDESESIQGGLYDRKDYKRIEELIQELNGLNDSKQLTEKTRKALFPKILENTFYSIQPIDEDMIDKINILNATCEAMRRACMDVVGQIRTTCIVLADGNNKIRGYEFPQKTVIKGDAKSASIAAASILAKVSRDEFMIKLDKEFPMYGWKHNKGYLSKEHMDAIVKYGPCKYHRSTFLRNMMDNARIEQQRLF